MPEGLQGVVAMPFCPPEMSITDLKIDEFGRKTVKSCGDW
jgi:hypothetical protein